MTHKADFVQGLIQSILLVFAFVNSRKGFDYWQRIGRQIRCQACQYKMLYNLVKFLWLGLDNAWTLYVTLIIGLLKGTGPVVSVEDGKITSKKNE